MVTERGAERSVWRVIGLWLDRVVAVLTIGGAVVAGSAAVLMVALITTEVIARSVFSTSTLMADEYSGYFLVAMTYLGLAYTGRSGLHVRVDSVIRFLPPRLRDTVVVSGLVISLAFLLLLAWETWALVRSSYEVQDTALTVRRTPLFLPELMIPVGLVLFCLLVLREIVWRLAGGRELPVTTGEPI